MTAIRNESLQAASCLLLGDIDPSLKDEEENTLLHIAVIKYFKQKYSISFEDFID